MTVQEAAHQILLERNQPMRPKEIAKTILERGLRSSAAQDPIFSFESTLLKNIRNGTYNKPKLIITNSERGQKLIGLPGWNNPRGNSESIKITLQDLKISVPKSLVDKIQLAVQAKVGDSFDDTVAKILQKGLAGLSSEIKGSLKKQLDELNQL